MAYRHLFFSHVCSGNVPHVKYFLQNLVPDILVVSGTELAQSWINVRDPTLVQRYSGFIISY